MALKRKREPTFAASEKNTLIELVEKYFSVVENKKTDSVTVRAKNEQWQKIATEFNSASNLHPRDYMSLRTCWENLKKRAKNLITMRNQHHLGTGGGPPKKIVEDPAIERVSEIIQTRVTGFINPFDSDGAHVLAAGSSTAEADTIAVEAGTSAAGVGSSIAEAEVEVTLTSDNQIFGTQVATECAETCTTYAVDWSQYNPSMLREPRNPVLVRSRSPSPGAEQRDVVVHAEIHEPEAQNPLPTPLSAPRSATTSARTSRRRPVLRREQSLNEERIKTLITTNAFAEEEHKLNMKILQVQELNERERIKQEMEKTKQEIEKSKQEMLKTKQEKIKLEILELELQKLKE